MTAPNRARSTNGDWEEESPGVWRGTHPMDPGEALDSMYEHEAELAAQQHRVAVPAPREQAYRLNADYPSVVLQNARVVPAAGDGAMDTARVQTELAIAQQVAVNQLHAQQQAETEAAERIASAALGRYIPPPAKSQAPARSVHR